MSPGLGENPSVTRMPKKGVERAHVLRALGEVFRAHGYEGASLTLITEATGLGKGSLYHLFPGGKEQMAAEVLADIDGWFELNIYAPLREADDARARDRRDDRGRRPVFSFRRSRLSGRPGGARFGARHVCRGRRRLFCALAGRAGAAVAAIRIEQGQAQRRAEDALLTIQGALVLARARNDAGIFRRALSDLTARLLAPRGVERVVPRMQVPMLGLLGTVSEMPNLR